MIDPEERCRNQEMEILRLRADLAMARKRVSDLMRMHDAAQRHIDTLLRRLDPQANANAMFKRLK